MTRRYTVPASRTTREARPERPYLWRGDPRLAEVNARLLSERQGRVVLDRTQYFSWPMPHPGAPKPSGGSKPKAQES